MNYKLELTQQEIQVISMALGELPLKQSIGAFVKVQQAVAEQDAENAVELNLTDVAG